MTKRIKEDQIATARLFDYTDFWIIDPTGRRLMSSTGGPTFTRFKLLSPDVLTEMPVDPLEIEMPDLSDQKAVQRVRAALMARLRTTHLAFSFSHVHTTSDGLDHAYTADYRIKLHQVRWIARFEGDQPPRELHGDVHVDGDTQADATEAVKAMVRRQLDAA